MAPKERAHALPRGVNPHDVHRDEEDLCRKKMQLFIEARAGGLTKVIREVSAGTMSSKAASHAVINALQSARERKGLDASVLPWHAGQDAKAQMKYAGRLKRLLVLLHEAGVCKRTGLPYDALTVTQDEMLDILGREDKLTASAARDIQQAFRYVGRGNSPKSGVNGTIRVDLASVAEFSCVNPMLNQELKKLSKKLRADGRTDGKRVAPPSVFAAYALQQWKQIEEELEALPQHFAPTELTQKAKKRIEILASGLLYGVLSMTRVGRGASETSPLTIWDATFSVAGFGEQVPIAALCFVDPSVARAIVARMVSYRLDKYVGKNVKRYDELPSDKYRLPASATLLSLPDVLINCLTIMWSLAPAKLSPSDEKLRGRMFLVDTYNGRPLAEVSASVVSRWVDSGRPAQIPAGGGLQPYSFRVTIATEAVARGLHKEDDAVGQYLRERFGHTQMSRQIKRYGDSEGRVRVLRDAGPSSAATAEASEGASDDDTAESSEG